MDSDLPEVTEVRKRLDAVRQTPVRVGRAPTEELYGRGGIRVNGNEISGPRQEAVGTTGTPQGERIVAVMGVFDPLGVAYAERVILRTEGRERIE